MTQTPKDADHGGALDIKPDDVLENISDEQLKTGRRPGSLKVPAEEVEEALRQRNEGSSTADDLDDEDQRGPYPPLRDQP